MKKIILCLILLLILIACKKGGDRQTFEVDVHTGTEGVVVKFMDRSPPDDAFEKSKIPIFIELQNKGAEPAVIDYAIISQERYLSVNNPRGKITLEGKSLYDPQGQIDNLQFTADVHALGKAGQTKETPLAFHICYPYKTTATGTACIDTEPRSTKQKVCTPGPISMGGGQGAPVGVTNIETDMRVIEGIAYPDFEITIANLHNGRILNRARYADACRLTTSGSEELYNVIRAEVFISDQRLDCYPKKRGQAGRNAYMIWGKDNDKITCSLPEGIKRAGNYPSPLRVVLEYGYTDHITTDILIKKR